MNFPKVFHARRLLELAFSFAPWPRLLCFCLVSLFLGQGDPCPAAAPPVERPPKVFFLVGENEYGTRATLPAFAKAELEPRGLHCVFSILPKDTDEVFPNIEELKDADLLFISVRRHAPPPEQMALIRAHVAAGKPVVGIRTASHAFGKRSGETEGAWEHFDREVLGGTYDNHYGRGLETFARIVPEAAGHPVLAGIPQAEFRVPSHLYKYPHLEPEVTLLMTARMQGRPEVEPVAWVNTAHQRRVFYTSLGSAEDFAVAPFRQLLLNGICWCLKMPVPPLPPATEEGAGAAPAKPSAAPRGAPAQTQALSPAESARAFQVAPDLEFEQLIAEPEVRQPVFLNFDERGRMWVVEYRQYPAPAGLKLLSHDAFWRAVYDKTPAPPPHHVRGLDRIVIHEDTHGDGRFDRHTVYLDGLNICTAVERGRGGAWVLNPPYLLFYPGEGDAPSGDPVVHLAGFGLEDTHSVTNSLRWGPDGWLYAAHGSTVTSAVIRPGLDREPCARIMGQGIWRYHPETRRFEVFSEGGGNTFAVEFDDQGRVFSGHNGGDTRGFHYQQGAYLRKGFDKHGPLSNPYAFGYFEAMAHPKVERFTHNFIVYGGGALPAVHWGHIFGAEPLQGRIVEALRIPVGSSFRTEDLGRPVISEDHWFRPVDIKAGPDGAIYVCDWYDAQINHWKNYNGQIDPSNGRIYRLKAKGAAPIPARDFSRMDGRQLLSVLSESNKWARQTALRVLYDRHDATLAPVVAAQLGDARGQLALELLWALHACRGLDDAAALRLLAHPEAQVRLWTARLIGDAGAASPEVGVQLARMAAKEPDLEARAQLACSARRLPPKEDFAIVRALFDHEEDTADARQPLLLWWALESKADSAREELLSLFRESVFWDLKIVQTTLLERIMRRYAATGARRDLLTCAALFDLAPSPEHGRKLLKGFEAAFQGRQLEGLPDELVAALRRQHIASPALAVRLGEPEAVAAALRSLSDEHAPAAAQAANLRALTEARAPGVAQPALALLDRSRDSNVRKAALTALAPFDDANIGRQVAALLPGFEPEVRSAALSLLASRPLWAEQLIATVESGSVPAASVPADVAAKLRRHSLPGLPERVGRLWPEATGATTAAMAAQIARLAPMIREGGGDPYRGRTLFLGTCAGCHTLHGEGGHIGPDLTTFKRDDIDSLLLSIVNPSAEIREGYESYFVRTNDGRLLNGFMVEQDPQTIVLRGLDGANTTLERSAVAELKAAGASLMPEGLLMAMNDGQIQDLFSYLRTSQPLPVKR